VPEAPGVAREGRALQVVPAESLLTVLVYRGGPLARAGHNHVVASHDLSGVAYLPQDVLRGSFELQFPVNTLVIDEADLRAREGEEFSAEVPDSAKEGTRKNMLGEALLDGQRYPHITLRSQHLESAGDGLLATVQVGVRDQVHVVQVPLSYTAEGDGLRVQGEMRLKQTDLGLTPFSLLAGALRVEDEMVVKFSVVARPAPGT